MRRSPLSTKSIIAAGVLLASLLFSAPLGHADPSRYPQFAQQSLPDNVKPSFISIDELVKEFKAGEKPLIVDVRTEEEFREVHILGARSAPLKEFRAYIASIPEDRLVVLY